MAAPINQEELTKLKSFIEFVSANPAILNLPQLGFFKKLIEQFGGKVPEGTFQMPAGAKCPFGGDVKCEDKSTTFAADEADEEVPEMEAESEESEVELDTEAKTSQLLLEPNVLYLQDKSYKIAKKQTTRRKKSTKRRFKKKPIAKRQTRIRLNKIQLQQNIKVEDEYNVDEYNDKNKNTDLNDPLFTPQLEFKCELNKDTNPSVSEEETEAEIYLDSDVDSDYRFEQYEEDDEEYDCKIKSETDDYDDEEKSKKLDNGNDDELFTLLNRTSTRKPYKKKKKTPPFYNCLETCKRKCAFKYDKSQRLDIFEYYFHLSSEDKVNFIRKHIRKLAIQRQRNGQGRNNCCYFLKHYKIDPTKPPDQTELECKQNYNSDIGNGNDELDLTKVCRKFFESTLGISSAKIKDAIEGYELPLERIVRPVQNTISKNINKVAEKITTKPQTFQQYLDPETGNLTVTKPKKKTKRRKRDEPPPKRFPKPINCAVRCKFKCHQNFSEEERKQICDSFWSLDYKRRKDFILARIETLDVQTRRMPEFRKTDRPSRTYQTKFYLRSGLKSENKRVCKHFMMNTLSINRWFIENAIEFADKITGSYTGTDRRGSRSSHNKIPKERRQIVKDIINSYPCWIPHKKSKTKYLHYDLSIRKMYDAYKDKCLSEHQNYVSTKYFYGVFHEDFNLSFLTSPHPRKGGGFLLTNPNLSHYTGEEAGGYWISSDGKKLDTQSYNPAKSLKSSEYNASADVAGVTSSMANSCNATDTSEYDALNVMPLRLVVNQSAPNAAVKSYLNTALYKNFSQDSQENL